MNPKRISTDHTPAPKPGNQPVIDTTVDRPSTLERMAPWIAASSTVTILLLYILNFYNQQISVEPEKWGAFGDYIGGLLNPIFSFFTLLVAIHVLRLQRKELQETKSALQNSAEAANAQLLIALRSHNESIYLSHLQDTQRSFESTARTASDSLLPPESVIRKISQELEKSQPLISLNSHAVSFAHKAPGYENPKDIEHWDWNISHSNESREFLRLMLPLCRAIGDTLLSVDKMPPEERKEKFRRFRNSLGEWPLSTFVYFLVMHPDGTRYQDAASAAHLFANLRIQRARCFAQTYLPAAAYTLSSEDH